MKFKSVADALKEPVAEKGTGNSIFDKILKFDIGDNIIRILPGSVAEVRQHFKTQPIMVCPRTEDEPCKLCDLRTRLWKRYGQRDSMPDNVRILYDSLKATTSFYYPAIKFTDSEMVVGYIRVSYTMNDALKAFIQSMDIADMEVKGIKVNFRKSQPKTQGAFPSISILPTKDTASEIEVPDWKEQLPDLDIMFPIANGETIDEYLNSMMTELNIDEL